MNRKFGGISERAHSNFEPEKCVSLKSIFIDFYEIFKNFKTFSGFIRIQDYHEPSQKYPPAGEVIGSPELHLSFFFQKKAFSFNKTVENLF